MTNSDAVVVKIEDGNIRDDKKRSKEKKSRRKNLLTAFSAEEKVQEILPLRLDTANECDTPAAEGSAGPDSSKTKSDDSSVAVPQTEDPVLPDGPGPAPIPIKEPQPSSPPVRVLDALHAADEMPVSGMSSDARSAEDIRHESASGIVYEIAEELYMREKTMSELEAMCSPPFHKVFTEEQRGELDSSASMRSKRIAGSISRASSTQPVFLPEDGYTSRDRPLSTAQAFFTQLLMVIPVVNIGAALVLAFSRRSNFNLRAIGRGFLIWSVILMTAALGFFAFHYFTSPDVVAKATGMMNVFYT